MKTIKTAYSHKSNKSERIAGLVFLFILVMLIAFSGLASAQENNNTSIQKGAVISAQSENTSVVITWNYAAESKYRFFLIERSTDGVHYELVSVVKNTGSINSTSFYMATDYNPLDGTSYYRISETELTGKPVHLFQVKYSNSTSLTQN